MYVWLNKSTITISDCIDTKCTACDFKGFVFHPSSKCSFLCLFLGTDWQISGILHTVRCYLSQLANRLECSFSSRSHRLHTQPRGFFLQNRVSDLVHGSPIPSIRTPLQDPVTNILPAVWPIQHLCATHDLFFSLRYKIKAFKQWKAEVGAATCPAHSSASPSVHADLSLLCFLCSPSLISCNYSFLSYSGWVGFTLPFTLALAFEILPH